MLSTIATNTEAQATNFTQTNTITALNDTISITGQGVYTLSASISGTWFGTLVIEGQTPDSAWVALPTAAVSNTLPYMQITGITSNGVYFVTCGGFTNLRVRASAFTSGTVNVNVALDDGGLIWYNIEAAATGTQALNYCLLRAF